MQNVTVKKTGKEWLIRAVLKNEARTPALMLRLKVAGEKSGRMLLPVFYSDNYFSLLPGEVKKWIYGFMMLIHMVRSLYWRY